MRHASTIYSSELQSYGHGMPLWVPEPANGHEIRIGDVGVVDETGQFQRFFNVTVGSDHPYNDRGVPPGFEVLQFDKRLISINERLVHPGVSPSNTVKYTKIETQAAGQDPTESIGASFSYAFECTEKQGALLILLEPGKLSAIPASSIDFRSYMARNYTQWVEFVTQTLRLEYDPEDLIFVRGTVKTTPSAWAVGAYLEEGSSVHKVSVHMNAGSAARVGFDLASQHNAGKRFDYRVGMGARDSPSSPSASGPPGAELPEVVLEQQNITASTSIKHRANQCIFLQYFKLKPRRSFFIGSSKIIAGAGPDELPPPEDPCYSSLIVADEGSYDVESDPELTHHNAIDDVLDYILKHSHADLAIASDEDVSRFHANSGSCSSTDFRRLIDEAKPAIVIDSSRVGALAANGPTRGQHSLSISAPLADIEATSSPLPGDSPKGRQTSGLPEISTLERTPAPGPNQLREILGAIPPGTQILPNSSHRSNMQEGYADKASSVGSISSSPQADGQDSWDVILEAMAQMDEKSADHWISELQNTVTFGCSFSAVVTSFLAGLYVALEDPSTTALLDHIASQKHRLNVTSSTPATIPAIAQPFQHSILSSLAMTVNRLWFTSLFMSLVAALFAMNVYPWLRRYKALSRFTTKEGVLMRERRRRTLYTWGVPLIVSWLPLLLQIAIILFVIGLAQLFYSLGYKFFLPFASVLYISIGFFAFTVLASIISQTCPYKSPTSFAILNIIKALRRLVAFTYACLGASMPLCSAVIMAALTSVPSLGQIADGWKAMLSLRFSTLVAPLRVGRCFYGGGYWACRERSTTAERDSGGLYASALSRARVYLPRKYRKHLMCCYETLPRSTQLMTAMKWITDDLNTEAVKLAQRQGFAVDISTLQGIDQRFTEEYAVILAKSFPDTWRETGNEEKKCGSSLLLALHTMAKNLPPSNDFLREYAATLTNLRRSQIDEFDAFRCELRNGHPDVRLPAALLFDCSESHEVVLDHLEPGMMLSWTQELFDGLKMPGVDGPWMNHLEIMYCSSATTLSTLTRHRGRLDNSVLRFLEALQELLSTQATRTRALTQMESESWHNHDIPFSTRRALLSIRRDLSCMISEHSLDGPQAVDARDLAKHCQRLIEGVGIVSNPDARWGVDRDGSLKRIDISSYVSLTSTTESLVLVYDSWYD